VSGNRSKGNHLGSRRFQAFFFFFFFFFSFFLRRRQGVFSFLFLVQVPSSWSQEPRAFLVRKDRQSSIAIDPSALVLTADPTPSLTEELHIPI